jgi:hypothetical protein
MSSPPARIRCREIEFADIDAAISILKQGFPNHHSNYWSRALARLTQYRGVPGLPKYGYLLEADDRPVGVLLVIYSEAPLGTQTIVRANIASWYVESQYRSHAAILTSRAHASREITYLQLTPARHVVPIIEAQGYRRYADGMFAAAALRCSSVRGAALRAVRKDLREGADLSRAECAVLLDHQSFGCFSLYCTVDGRRHPFVFARRWRRTRFGWLPYARLVYCRGLDEFARFAGPLGRYLALRGMPVVFMEANAPLPGVPGRFLNEAAKFFKGPHQPRLGDISYTELAIFGS